MNAPDDLSIEDARSVIALLADVVICAGGIDAQKTALMNGLAGLIDADSWAWAATFRFKTTEVALNSNFLTGGFSPEQFARFQEALEHPDTGVMNESFSGEFQARQAHITRLREQVDPTGFFPRSAAYPIWIAAGIEQVILSLCPGRDGVLSHIGLYRGVGRPPFSSRESRIAHIVLSEVPWLHHSRLASDIGPSVVALSPRQRITLNLLLDGQSRSQIAAHLGLSPATVGSYVKEVFRHFSVHSQPQLIARFRRGDGGDFGPDGSNAPDGPSRLDLQRDADG